jgi:hypothetical protein
MKKNPYNNLSEKDLAEVYFTTKANYGKIDGVLLEEINSRGGERKFLEQLSQEKALDAEKTRIRKEVADLMSDQLDLSFIKKLIHSDLLRGDELSQFIDKMHHSLAVQKFNAKIDSATFVGSLIGILIGTAIGAVICIAQLVFLGKFFYASLVLVYFFSWLSIRIITKKNAANAMVLLSAIVATCLGPLLAFPILGNQAFLF